MTEKTPCNLEVKYRTKTQIIHEVRLQTLMECLLYSVIAMSPDPSEEKYIEIFNCDPKLKAIFKLIDAFQDYRILTSNVGDVALIVYNPEIAKNSMYKELVTVEANIYLTKTSRIRSCVISSAELINLIQKGASVGVELIEFPGTRNFDLPCSSKYTISDKDEQCLRLYFEAVSSPPPHSLPTDPEVPTQ